MGVSGKSRLDEIQPIRRMKDLKHIRIRAVGGYLTILLVLPLASPAAPGDINTIAGDGNFEFPTYGDPATSTSVNSPKWLAVDPDGNLYLSDQARQIGYIDKATGILSHFASVQGSAPDGDGGAAVDAGFGLTAGVALDAAGNLYIADSVRHTIRRVDHNTGLISTIAGTGVEGFSGDGGLAISAQLMKPNYLTVDRFNNVYVGDSDGKRIRRIDGSTGIITTVVGTGTNGFSGDGGPASSAEVNLIRGMTTDPTGNLYFADSANHRIRKIDVSTGIIDTVVSRGAGPFIEDVDALVTRLFYPFDICLDGGGNLFIADHSYYGVRRIDAETNIATTITGTEMSGYSGDGGPALGAANKGIHSLAMDYAGNLYLADYLNYRVRMIEGAGVPITPIADPVTVPATDLIDRSILLRKMKKLKKKLRRAKKAGRTSTVRKLKKQIKKLQKQF